MIVSDRNSKLGQRGGENLGFSRSGREHLTFVGVAIPEPSDEKTRRSM